VQQASWEQLHWDILQQAAAAAEAKMGHERARTEALEVLMLNNRNRQFHLAQ
jgi:hypothetical protein